MLQTQSKYCLLLTITSADRFVPSKYKNVESRLYQPSARPQTAKFQHVVAAKQNELKPPQPSRNKSNDGSKILTAKALTQLPKADRASSFVAKQPLDPEVIVHADKNDIAEGTDENFAQNNQQQVSSMHKDFGKVPKYLAKYKEEAEALAQKRAELKAKKALPKGMRQVSEEERVSTLEELVATKKELNDILQHMPISLQTNGLRQKKRELEDKLSTIDKAISTFSRKTVYV